MGHVKVPIRGRLNLDNEMSMIKCDSPCDLIIFKDTASYRVAKRIAPSLSLLKEPSLKIRNRTTLSQRIDKLFMAVLSFPA